MPLLAYLLAGCTDYDINTVGDKNNTDSDDDADGDGSDIEGVSEPSDPIDEDAEDDYITEFHEVLQTIQFHLKNKYFYQSVYFHGLILLMI